MTFFPDCAIIVIATKLNRTGGKIVPLLNYSTNVSECQELSEENDLEVLSDRNARGKERPWQKMKIDSSYIALAYEDFNSAKSFRVRDCASWLAFSKIDGGKLKLAKANFCRVRMCPMCGWRRSLKVHSQMEKILNYAATVGKYKYLMLTLTVQNCTPQDLKSTLDKLFGAFNKFNQRAPFKRAVLGWYRGVEITHNVQADTYHPHIHCLLMVNPSYFTSRDYLSQAKLTEMWKSCLRVNYTPVIDVRKCYGSGVNVISEVAKYTTKTNEILNFDDWQMTVDTLRVLDDALAYRRFVAFGGLLKEFHKKLNLEDVEDGDLVNVGEEEEAASDKGKEIYYFWHTGYCQYLLE